jgi:hypothetical protein
MKIMVEAYLKCGTRGLEILRAEVSSVDKRYTGFFARQAPELEYALLSITDEVFHLSGDAFFVYRVLGNLLEDIGKSSWLKILAVDTYTNYSEYLKAIHTAEYKNRFKSPYHLVFNLKKHEQPIFVDPYSMSWERAAERKTLIENGTFSPSDDYEELSDYEDVELTVAIKPQIPGHWP